ncbi:hypothetical protein [Rhodococcus jostii]
MQKAQLVFVGIGLAGAGVLGCTVAAMWPDPNVAPCPLVSVRVGWWG